MVVDNKEYDSENNEDEEEGTYLTDEEKQKTYKPWAYSIIIKVLGRKMNHLFLKRKLTMMWRVIGNHPHRHGS